MRVAEGLQGTLQTTITERDQAVQLAARQQEEGDTSMKKLSQLCVVHITCSSHAHHMMITCILFLLLYHMCGSCVDDEIAQLRSELSTSSKLITNLSGESKDYESNYLEKDSGGPGLTMSQVSCTVQDVSVVQYRMC